MWHPGRAQTWQSTSRFTHRRLHVSSAVLNKVSKGVNVTQTASDVCGTLTMAQADVQTATWIHQQFPGAEASAVPVLQMRKLDLGRSEGYRVCPGVLSGRVQSWGLDQSTQAAYPPSVPAAQCLFPATAGLESSNSPRGVVLFACKTFGQGENEGESCALPHNSKASSSYLARDRLV